MNIDHDYTSKLEKEIDRLVEKNEFYKEKILQNRVEEQNYQKLIDELTSSLEKHKEILRKERTIKNKDLFKIFEHVAIFSPFLIFGIVIICL